MVDIDVWNADGVHSTKNNDYEQQKKWVDPNFFGCYRIICRLCRIALWGHSTKLYEERSFRRPEL